MQNETKQRKKGSGGSRKGAGRKPNYKGETKEIGITIPINEEVNVRKVVKEYLSESFCECGHRKDRDSKYCTSCNKFHSI